MRTCAVDVALKVDRGHAQEGVAQLRVAGASITADARMGLARRRHATGCPQRRRRVGPCKCSLSVGCLCDRAL